MLQGVDYLESFSKDVNRLAWSTRHMKMSREEVNATTRKLAKQSIHNVVSTLTVDSESRMKKIEESLESRRATQAARPTIAQVFLHDIQAGKVTLRQTPRRQTPSHGNMPRDVMDALSGSPALLKAFS